MGINDNGSTPNASAMLDVSSTTRGFLPPRMTYAQRVGISSPTAGLMVWCTNCGAYGEMQVYNGTAWTNFTGGAASGIVPGAPTIGTATAVHAQASVSFTQPASNGGSAITSYTATSNPGSITGTLNQSGSGTITVTGLTDGTAYTFTVTATNAAGTGPASAASNSVTPNFAIGQSYGGGIIAYILQSGDPGYVAGETHGLIAATADQSNGTWGCSGTSISGATGTAIGTGQANTSAIVAGCGTAGIAARVCNDYTVTVSGVTYSDWYLPSKDELEKLYINRVAIGGFSDNIGYNYYWSSSQYNANDAWDHYFTNGIQYNAVKYATSYVRAVRTF